LLAALAVSFVFASASAPKPAVATAYSGHGTTSTGTPVHRGVVAADPRFLPPGSKVKISHAGPASGIYRVQDTGGKVRGRKVDIYMPSHRQSRQFGKRKVKVQVVSRHPRR
jgi:3D (Asp-Asp-Asp) domain-containing protein